MSRVENKHIILGGLGLSGLYCLYYLHKTKNYNPCKCEPSIEPKYDISESLAVNNSDSDDSDSELVSDPEQVGLSKQDLLNHWRKTQTDMITTNILNDLDNLDNLDNIDILNENYTPIVTNDFSDEYNPIIIMAKK